MRSRLRIIVACAFAALLLGLLFARVGYEATWRLWNIPTMSPHFADLRTITGGADEYAHGIDPLADNPGDPWRRRQNYPRVWQGLYALGVDEGDTTALGVTFIALFLIGVCLATSNGGTPVALAVLAALLSPAVLLGVERANSDLLMFFLVAAAVAAIRPAPVLAAAAIVAAFVLKLFPVFACATFLRLQPGSFRRYALVLAAVVAGYVLLTFSDIALIRAGTPQGTFDAYGMGVLHEAARNVSATVSTVAAVLSWAALAAVLAWSFTAARSPGPGADESPSAAIDAFRAGASIYAGTFVLGNNYDYRLVFLILALPQLVVWCRRRPERSMSRISAATLAAGLLSMWFPMMFAPLVRHLPGGSYAAFAFDELLNWIAFAGLLYLLVWSTPLWFRQVLRIA